MQRDGIVKSVDELIWLRDGSRLHCKASIRAAKGGGRHFLTAIGAGVLVLTFVSCGGKGFANVKTRTPANTRFQLGLDLTFRTCGNTEAMSDLPPRQNDDQFPLPRSTAATESLRSRT